MNNILVGVIFSKKDKKMKQTNVWGFLRETNKKATGLDPATGIHRTGLEEYLKIIFPHVNDWVYDKSILNHPNDLKLKTRPDYRGEKLNMIIEFDGLQHYTNPLQIEKDIKNTRNYQTRGYTVIRIPYFIQLTNSSVKSLFNLLI